jgi:hypothetical protein
MITFETVGIAVVAMMAFFPCAVGAANNKLTKELVRPILVVGGLASLFCVVAGLSMAPFWAEPLVNVETTDARYHRGSGVIAVAISFWPYFLIGFGALSMFNAVVGFRNASRLSEVK